jgi:predicted enzyme related to lactoylglutathione lyase
MLSNGVVRWFEIYVQDVDRARRFYEGVFGYSLSLLQAGDIEMWTFGHESAAMGTTTGAIVRAKGCVSGIGGTLVYFGCNDCAIEESRVPAFGGRVHRSKMAIGEYGFVSLVFDTEENLIRLHSAR